MTVLTPAQVCEELGIQDSTLRKYSLLLEKEGMGFERHKNNRRKYNKTHVITLKRTLELMKNDDITLEKAMHQALRELKANPIIEEKTVMPETVQRNNNVTTAILLEEIIELKNQLSEQETRQKERDTLFVEALEELHKEIQSLKQERQKQLSEASEEVEKEIEEIPVQEEKPKKKNPFFFWRKNR